MPDSSWEHCERTITGALTLLQGVESVRVDIPRKQVQVEYDDSRVSVERFKQVLDEEADTVESVTK